MDEHQKPDEQQGAGAPSVRSGVEELRARAFQTLLQLEGRFGERRSVDIVRDVVLLDRAVAGGELAGALAYRLFLWFLPFVLVLVSGLGVYSDASDQSPREVADRLGLAGLVVHSVAAAATSSARWYALLIGLPILLYLTRSLLRTVVAVHRLAWGLEPRRGHLTPANVLLFLAVNVFTQLVVVWVGDTREDTYGALGLAATVLFSLWLTSRVIVVSAVVNAVLWSRGKAEQATLPDRGRS